MAVDRPGTSFIGLQNYVNLFTKDTTFRSAILNTLYFVAAYVPLNIVVAMTVAVWLQGYRRRSARYSRSLFCPGAHPSGRRRRGVELALY